MLILNVIFNSKTKMTHLFKGLKITRFYNLRKIILIPDKK